MKFLAAILMMYSILGCSQSSPLATGLSSQEAESRTAKDELKTVLERNALAFSILLAESPNKLLDDDQVEKFTETEAKQIINSLLPQTEDAEKQILTNTSCTDEERKQAIARNSKYEFEFSSEIDISDLNSIIELLHRYPFYDPRILMMTYIDKDTVEIMTGVIRGPLNGGGSIYTFTRVNGVWRVTRSRGWVS